MKQFLTPNNMTAFFSPKFGQKIDEEETVEKKENFVIGQHYLLKGADCDEFTMPSKEYELIGIINEMDGIVLDSLIMKQISGSISTIFSLTKADCANLGIEFQSGLQIFPKNFGWIPLNNNVELIEEKKEKEFDSSNLSTYPCDFVTKTIRYMICKIHGFAMLPQSPTDEMFKLFPVKTPNNTVVEMDKFLHSLQVHSKYNLRQGDGGTISGGQTIPYRIITKEITDGRYRVFDAYGSMYIELRLENSNNIGVIPSQFEDGNEISHYFGITWNESDFLTHF